MSLEESKILYIIKDIQSFDKHGDVTNLFTKGYCWEFACIIKKAVPSINIKWWKNRRHYILEYNKKYFDITGELIIPSSAILTDDNEENLQNEMY